MYQWDSSRFNRISEVFAQSMRNYVGIAGNLPVVIKKTTDICGN